MYIGIISTNHTSCIEHRTVEKVVQILHKSIGQLKKVMQVFIWQDVIMG
jgi:hypothetical protein